MGKKDLSHFERVLRGFGRRGGLWSEAGVGNGVKVIESVRLDGR